MEEIRAAKDGYTIVIALESFDGESATTTATIEVSPPAGGETSTTKTVKTGTPENPQGITLFDPSGNPYCVKGAIGGAVVYVPGKRKLV